MRELDLLWVGPPRGGRESAEETVRSLMSALILIALAIAAGRMAVVRSAGGEVPFLSANDRSRWATVSSLVEDGTYRIDRQMAIRDPETRRRTWQSIDRVRHLGRDGQLHDYSSKPPLLATLVAGIYAATQPLLGLTLTSHPMYVGRLLLALTNLPLLAIFLVAMRGVLLQSAASAWGRLFGMAAACFGTMLLSFSVSLNNHLPAAAATAVVLWIMLDEDRPLRIGWMFAAGLAAAFTVANELPALSMLGLWGMIALWRRPLAAILGFVPGVAVVAAAFFGTNWLAHESWRPPYAHRGNGPLVAEVVPLEDAEEDADPETVEAPDATTIGEALVAAGVLEEPAIELRRSVEPGRWLAQPAGQARRFAVVRNADWGWEIRQWDDWYEYEGSYWTSGRRQGVDRGEPSRRRYAFHMFLGHHGIFSLTPLWCLAVIGWGYWMRDGEPEQRGIALAVAAASGVCIAFYILRPLIDRNYGGVSSAFRWLLWFAPLWLWSAVAAIDRCTPHRWARGVAGLLLALSVFSMATALANPWQQPWIYQYWSYLGWLVD